MSNRTRLRAMLSVLAVGAASLALVSSAGADQGGAGGVVIQSRDACDPATFPVPCVRSDNSGGTVSFNEFLAVVGKKHSHPAWRFTEDNVTVRRGTPVVAEFGRGGEVHSFTDVTDMGGFGRGCIDLLNDLLVFPPGSPSTVARCGPDPIAGLGAILGTPDAPNDGLFPGGKPVVIDTSTPGTREFQCMIHPWMQTTITVE